MICQYSVKNYKSINEEITLNMEALDISEYRDSLITCMDNEKYLPLTVIYGPNGGGKSNVLLSLCFLINKIVKPVREIFKKDETILQKKNSNSCTIPYKFDENSVLEPSTFDLYFRYKNYEYHYYASIINENFLEEYLSRKRIGSTRYINIFSRDEREIELCRSLSKNNAKDILKNISKDISLISYLRVINNKNPIVKSVYEWFEYGIICIDNTNSINRFFYINALIAIEDIDDNHEKIVNIMKEMDIDIEDYNIVEENGSKEIYTKHIVNNKEKFLNFNEESTGTKKLAQLLSLILISLHLGSTLVIDELDCNIHPKLLGYIMKMFSNKNINKKGSQLIFTSHDLVTMSSEYLRRDEIWFVAKNSEESSFLYSLAEFKKDNGKIARKDETYSKQYLEGRYGSDPYLQKIIKW